jgi:hypothetical protein
MTRSRLRTYLYKNNHIYFYNWRCELSTLQNTFLTPTLTTYRRKILLVSNLISSPDLTKNIVSFRRLDLNLDSHSVAGSNQLMD